MAVAGGIVGDRHSVDGIVRTSEVDDHPGLCVAVVNSDLRTGAADHERVISCAANELGVVARLAGIKRIVSRAAHDPRDVDQGVCPGSLVNVAGCQSANRGAAQVDGNAVSLVRIDG